MMTIEEQEQQECEDREHKEWVEYTFFNPDDDEPEKYWSEDVDY